MQNSVDFYMGIQKNSQWIGSCRGDIIFDLPRYILKKEDWYKYLTSVLKYLKLQEISAICLSGESWMWTYPDSKGSDYSIYFDYSSKKVLASVPYFEHYCDGKLLSKGSSLEEASVSIPVEYPLMKSYQVVNREGELITVNGQYPA